MFYGELVAICIKGKSLFWAHSSFSPFFYGVGVPRRLYIDGEMVRDIFSLVGTFMPSFQGATYSLRELGDMKPRGKSRDYPFSRLQGHTVVGGSSS